MIIVVDTTRALTEAQYVLLVTTRNLFGGEHIRVADDHTAIWFDHQDQGEAFHTICLRNDIHVSMEQ